MTISDTENGTTLSALMAKAEDAVKMFQFLWPDAPMKMQFDNSEDYFAATKSYAKDLTAIDPIKALGYAVYLLVMTQAMTAVSDATSELVASGVTLPDPSTVPHPWNFETSDEFISAIRTYKIGKSAEQIALAIESSAQEAQRRSEAGLSNAFGREVDRDSVETGTAGSLVTMLFPDAPQPENYSSPDAYIEAGMQYGALLPPEQLEAYIAAIRADNDAWEGSLDSPSPISSHDPETDPLTVDIDVYETFLTSNRPCKVVRILNVDTGESVVGVAVKNPTDPALDPLEGFRLAFERALNLTNFSKSRRRDMWKEYLAIVQEPVGTQRTVDFQNEASASFLSDYFDSVDTPNLPEKPFNTFSNLFPRRK